MEPFDLKLFVYHCARRWNRILLGALLGLLLIGGGYFFVKVAAADPRAYQIVDKYYVEFGTDPQLDMAYSYFTGYTWTDWLTSDEWAEAVKKELSFPVTKEELAGWVQAEIKSDVRVVYVTITHPEEERARELAEVYRREMEAFGERQRQIDGIRLIDTEGPALEFRDVRPLRACVLGIVVGGFFAWFFIGFRYLVEDKLYLPEDFTERYDIPAAGYLSGKGASATLAANLAHVLQGKTRIGLTAVDPALDLKAAEALLPCGNCLCVPSLLQNPEGGEQLRGTEANLLLVRSGRDGDGAIRALLYQARLQEVPFDAAVLVDVDERMIQYYRWDIRRKRT